MEGGVVLAHGRRRPHVLLFPFPAQGHINPLLDLGDRLGASGILSTLVLPRGTLAKGLVLPEKHPLVRFAALHLPPHIDAKLSSGDQSWEMFEIVDTELLGPLTTFIRSYAAADVGEQPPISCLVSDSFMPWTVELAGELGIPRVEMWTASATAYIFGSSILPLISKGLLPFIEGTQDIVLDFLPGVSTSRLGNVPVDTLRTKDLTHPVFQILVRSFLRGADSRRVLVNSFHGVEAGAVEALRAQNVKMTPIGPTFGVGHNKDSPSLLDEAQSKCLRWLDKQAPKSVVYVAFGSAGFLSGEELRELASALEAFGRPFLWAIRDGSAIESLPLSFRSGNLPNEKGLIVSWAPQRHVLGHGSVGAFVSHCGWNSMLESIWNGVPVVVCPRLAEQNTNMWLAQEWGIGVAGVDTMMGGVGSLRSATLVNALRSVMGKVGVEESLTQVKLRKKVVELAAVARAAISPSGTSTQAFQEFVDDLLEVKC